MKLRSPLMFAALLGFAATASAQAVICTPEEALKKAEETAVTINRIAAGDPAKAERMHEQLKALQERDPTQSHHGACEAYDRVIKELERQDTNAS
ncbi:hypothetical protein BN1049_00516 [Pseudomonas saudimassiliensis]|uniref:Lipoprotein n=1 Tax=Pseudomonas saudimassiliensis TaxID=1461581 RepID=A0A078M2T7_9PSED|nr:hypothetical protein [Pseudomonas saudimassiliensis]CEA01733.1 hypothetical protein BN1049_00516 [Pseudomonas saudimassiliensis]CEF25609.1 hypothetical protein BN1049_00516 [Pseudomonas saudimassiliensis]